MMFWPFQLLCCQRPIFFVSVILFSTTCYHLHYSPCFSICKWVRNGWNASGCNTSLDWQVKTTYSWCGLTGRKSLFKTNLTGVPSLTSTPPSLLLFRAPFYFALLPTIWTPGTGYNCTYTRTYIHTSIHTKYTYIHNTCYIPEGFEPDSR